jgi:putative transposase
VPKLRQQTFETAIIERFRRRESSVEEALLWGTRVSPSTVSDLNKRIYGTIEAWRERPIEGEHPYVYLDGIVLKRSWAGEVRNVSLLVAIGVNGHYREILGICEGAKEDKAGWSAFLKHFKERGLNGVRLIISDACLGLAESAAEFFPEAAWQRCIVGSLKKWPPHRLYAAIGPATALTSKPAPRRDLRNASGLQDTIQRRRSARRAAASRLRLMAAAVR